MLYFSLRYLGSIALTATLFVHFSAQAEEPKPDLAIHLDELDNRLKKSFGSSIGDIDLLMKKGVRARLNQKKQPVESLSSTEEKLARSEQKRLILEKMRDSLINETAQLRLKIKRIRTGREAKLPLEFEDQFPILRREIADRRARELALKSALAKEAEKVESLRTEHEVFRQQQEELVKEIGRLQSIAKDQLERQSLQKASRKEVLELLAEEE